MILALVMAFSVVTTLQAELDSISDPARAAAVRDSLPALPMESPTPTAQFGAGAPPVAGAAQETPTAFPTPTATAPITPVLATALQTSNVRPAPALTNEPIGRISLGDEVIVLGQTADANWYLIRLGADPSPNSIIEDTEGRDVGWVSTELLSTPDGDVPIIEDPETFVVPTPVPAATISALPTPTAPPLP
jgi:hypothetical protein